MNAHGYGEDVHIDVERINQSLHGVFRGIEVALDRTGGKTMTIVGGNARTVQRDLGEASHLTLHCRSGNVTIQGYGGSTVQVWANDVGEEAPFEVSGDGDRLRIDSSGDEDDSVDFRVRVPENCTLEVHGDDGDVSVESVCSTVTITAESGDVLVSHATGTFSLTAADGDISILNAKGTCSLRAADGDVTCRRFGGTVHIDAADGDARIAESLLNECSVDAVNGDASVESALISGGKYRVRSVNGDVALWIAPDPNATVHIAAPNGEIVSRLAGIAIGEEQHEWEGQFGDGSAEVRIESLNGDVMIGRGSSGRAVEPIPPVAAVEPVPPVPSVPSEMPAGEYASASQREGSETTIAILAELERGELTVEEAMARLDAMS